MKKHGGLPVRKEKTMIKIMFICHGNICRSPMAEFIMKDIVRKNHREGDFLIESAATSTEELGNPVYPPARRMLAQHGISCQGKSARQFRADEYDKYDMIIVMDYNNMKNLKRIVPNDFDNKFSMLLDYTSDRGSVSDPWYTRDFEKAYSDIYRGCLGLFDYLTK